MEEEQIEQTCRYLHTNHLQVPLLKSRQAGVFWVTVVWGGGGGNWFCIGPLADKHLNHKSELITAQGCTCNAWRKRNCSSYDLHWNHGDLDAASLMTDIYFRSSCVFWGYSSKYMLEKIKKASVHLSTELLLSVTDFGLVSSCPFSLILNKVLP